MTPAEKAMEVILDMMEEYDITYSEISKAQRAYREKWREEAVRLAKAALQPDKFSLSTSRRKTGRYLHAGAFCGQLWIVDGRVTRALEAGFPTVKVLPPGENPYLVTWRLGDY